MNTMALRVCLSHLVYVGVWAGLVSGCKCAAPKQENARLSEAMVRVVDATDTTVELEGPADRIAALSPGFVEILYAVGCGERIVLRDSSADYPEEARALPHVDGVRPPVSHIAGFRPDLVLLYTRDDARRRAFSRIGITSALFDPSSLAGVARTIEKIGIMCGKSQAAASLADRFRIALRSETPVADAGPSVYVELDNSDGGRPWTASNGSFVHEMLQLAGARNAFPSLGTPYGQVSVEAVVRADADYILIPVSSEVSRKDIISGLKRRPGVGGMRAVERGTVITHISADLLSRPGPRLLDGLSLLRDVVDGGDR